MTNNRTTATGRRTRCGTHTLVGPLAESENRFGYFRHRCKSYACSICGPKKLRKARRRIGEVAHEKQLTRLATLTLDPRKIPAGKPAIEYLRETWRKMRVSLKRRLGVSPQFIAVLELHRSGMPHLHVLVGSYLPQDWLSTAWQGVGGGRIVDIRFVDVHRVSAYLSKYFTKDSLAEIPSGVRRFSCSKGIALWERKAKNPGWWLSKVSIEELRDWAKLAADEKWQEVDGVLVLAYFTGERIPIAESLTQRPGIRPQNPRGK